MEKNKKKENVRIFYLFIESARLIVMLRSEAWVKMSRSRRFPKMQNFALDRTCNEFDLAKEGRANERRTNRALKQPLVGQGCQIVF